jgi:hypothetical protein
MKQAKTLGWALITVCLLATNAFAQKSEGGYVDFGKLPAAEHREFVEVNIQSNLIAMVGRLAEKAEPDVASLIRGIKCIRVNVLGLDDSNRSEIESKIKSLRQELADKGWDRIVTAQQKDGDVCVYVKTRGQEAFEGIVVTVIEGKKEAVLVNLVGDISPDKIALIGEKFNLDPLKQAGQTIEAAREKQAQ